MLALPVLPPPASVLAPPGVAGLASLPPSPVLPGFCWLGGSGVGLTSALSVSVIVAL